MNKPIIQIFTDGSCLGNPGPGGYGALLRYGRHEKELSKGFFLTTNNRMELLAAIESLKAIRSKKEQIIHLTTDSQYVRLGVTQWMPKWIQKNWQKSDKKEVLNKDLWLELKKLLEQLTVEWFWIRGHSGHLENTRCDYLAQQAARTPSHNDEVYEQQKLS